ncbi:hypothetical protein FIV50_05665 [Microbacterium foliorum]|uniref:Uncharacterized protein n=1 Tax=Microbacterium foliorum TaxID=104336 RepID=A0A4Y5YNC9_9MICO|nr:DUF6264 family protein [Microbacterium foliorum]QDE34321.1 hypothetical protein FIV50_05665 [Microbacterium foliorum]
MTDQRPQYGEIATLDEQRRAAGLPPLDEVPAVEVGAAPAPADGARVDSAAARARPVDRFVTIALLAYGLVNVVMTGLSYLDFATAMNQMMSVLGVDGDFTNYAEGRTWGTIAAIVLAVGWSLTAYFSIRRLRTRKLSWWVPLVGAAITLLVASVCAAIPLMNDPAFIDFVANTAGQ